MHLGPCKMLVLDRHVKSGFSHMASIKHQHEHLGSSRCFISKHFIYKSHSVPRASSFVVDIFKTSVLHMVTQRSRFQSGKCVTKRFAKLVADDRKIMNYYVMHRFSNGPIEPKIMLTSASAFVVRLQKRYCHS